nr:LytTR family DNA-binding domain-containing protein [uncultured Eisenbergiella sp.]
MPLITLCDDSLQDLMYTEKMLLRYQERYPDNLLAINKYSDPGKLYARTQEGEYADIYILDILMPGRSGIQLGQLIRSRSRDSILIYTTSSEDYALEAYQVLAGRYLVKPFGETAFQEAMRYALAQTDLNREPVFRIKTAEGVLAVPYSAILYVECRARSLFLYTKDGNCVRSIVLRRPFEEEVKELLESWGFVQIHKSFAVNMDHIRRYKQDSITMDNGQILPVSRNKAPQVKRKYLGFMTDKYR